jgi:hypothetical protein
VTISSGTTFTLVDVRLSRVFSRKPRMSLKIVIQSPAFPFKVRKMSNYDWILMFQKRKFKLNRVLDDAKNRIEFGCILPELFVIKRIHKFLIHPVVSYLFCRQQIVGIKTAFCSSRHQFLFHSYSIISPKCCAYEITFSFFPHMLVMKLFSAYV